MKHPALAALLALLIPAAAADTPADFAAHWPIQTDTSAPYYRLQLPLAVYQASARGDLRDLRVFNAAGQPVPHARLGSTSEVQEQLQHQALQWIPLHSSDAASPDASLSISVRQGTDGSLIRIDSQTASAGEAERRVQAYLFDLGAQMEYGKARALQLDWQPNAHDFQLVDLESSADLQRWRPVASAAQLARLDYQGARIEQGRIEFTATPQRYLRLRWRTPTEAPVLTRTDLELTHTSQTTPALVWSDAIGPQPADKTLGPGEYRFQLAQALPLARLRFELPPGNQLLPLEILLPGRERLPSRSLTRGVVYQIETDAQRWRNTDIPLAGQRLREFIVRLDPRLPAPALQLRYALQPDEIVFLASGAQPYQLAIGKAQQVDAALPINTLIPGFGGAGAPGIQPARLGDASQRPAANAASAPAASTADWRKQALWGVLILGVLAMAAMAWSLARQMRQQTPPAGH